MSRYLRALTFALLFTCAAAAETGQVSSVLDMTEFVQDWKISKQFTIDVANAMPAEYYTFKPNPDEMTFGEQMVHIAGGNVFRFNQITGIQPPFAFDPAKAPCVGQAVCAKAVGAVFRLRDRSVAADYSRAA